MRRRFAVLLIFGMLVFSGALFADSISDVFFVSGRVTASGFPAMFTIEEGAEPFPPLGVSINGMIKGCECMPPMLAVMLLDKNNTASDVIFTKMTNGVEKAHVLLRTLRAWVQNPKGLRGRSNPRNRRSSGFDKGLCRQAIDCFSNLGPGVAGKSTCRGDGTPAVCDRFKVLPGIVYLVFGDGRRVGPERPRRRWMAARSLVRSGPL